MKYPSTLLTYIIYIADRKSILVLLITLLAAISASAKKKKKPEERPDAMKAGVIMKKVDGGYYFFDSTGKKITYSTVSQYAIKQLGNGYIYLNSALCGDDFGFITTVVNPQGKLIIPCIYDKIDTTGTHYFVATKKTADIFEPIYKALYDTLGNMLIPAEYRDITALPDGTFEVTLNKTSYIGDLKTTIDGDRKRLSIKNEMLTPENLSFEKVFQGKYKGYSLARKEKHLGVLNQNNKEIVPFAYNIIKPIEGAPHSSYWFKATITGSNGDSWSKWYNEKGNIIADSVLADADIEKFHENGKSIVKHKPRFYTQHALYGVIDTVAKTVIPIVYSDIKWLPKEKLYKARIGNKSTEYKWGLLSEETGAIVLPVVYDSISDFKDGLATVYQTYSKGTINSRGEMVNKAEYDFRMEYKVLIWDKEENLYRARKGTKPSDYKWGLLDEKGNVIAPFEYDTIGRFIEGSAFVSKAIYNGAINNKGEMVGRKSYNFQASKAPTEGLMPAKYKGLWGYADSLGNIVIPFSYDEAFNFRNGLAVVRLGDKHGAIDHNNKKVIDITFENISSFDEDGLARFKTKGKWGILHKDKGIIVPPKYESVSAFSNGVAIAIYHYGSNKVTLKIDKEGRTVDSKEEIEKTVQLREHFTWIAELTGDPKNPHKTTPRTYIVTPTGIEMYMNKKRYYNYNILKSMHHTQEGIPGYFYYCNDDKIFFFSTDQANGNRMILEGTNKGGFKDVYFIPY